ncbi:MAG: tRNA lysidine(34) synthetase TilS [Pirellula sp.]|nr:tRNA lysidine(34) synthetase TilS [Pirellula sp.]
MSSTLTFERQIATNWPTERWQDEVMLVAVSGGADSVAMLLALSRLRPKAAGGRLVVGHLNHQLRGAESDADEDFVRSLADRLRVPAVVHSGFVAETASQTGRGLEETAREVRHAFLAATAERLGARYIATAHTLDDQAETLLMRLLRGTGLAGLAGIPKARAVAGGGIGLVRPMLNIRRSEVLEYLASLGQPFREDSSNTDRAYTRNRLRHDLLPQLARDYNPRIVETLANLATQAEEIQAALRPAVEELLKASLRRNDASGFELDCSALRTAPRHLMREVLIAAWTEAGIPLQAMGFAEWNALAEMAIAETPSKRMLPGGVTAEYTDFSIRVQRP